jgi:hypothetical protein
MKAPNGGLGLGARLAILVLAGLAVAVTEPGLRAQDVTPEGDPAPAPETSVEVADDAAGDVAAPEVARRVLGDQVAMFTKIHIGPEEEVRGALTCIGCTAVIEGTVKREVVVVGGSVVLSGTVEREMVNVLSNVTLEEGAEIRREFVNVLGDFEDEGATFNAGRVNIPMPIKMPFRVGGPFPILAALLAWLRLLSIVVLFVSILILVAFVPERIKMISDDVGTSLGMAYLVGLLGYLVLFVVEPVLYFILVSSVIGIPAIPIIVLIIYILVTLGTAGLFHYMGFRMGMALNREMSLLGAILLGFLPWALLLVLPAFFGFGGLIVALAMKFLFWLVVKVPALGLVIMTRAGGRPRFVEQPPTQLQTQPVEPPPPAAPPTVPPDSTGTPPVPPPVE